MRVDVQVVAGIPISGQMDRHELMVFLRGANISITQNDVQLPATPFENDINAYVNGRFEEIQAHEAGKEAGSMMGEQDRGDELPAKESEP